VRGGPTGGQVEVVKEGVDGRGLVARAHRVRCGRQGTTTPGAQAGTGLVEEVPGGNGRSLAVAGEEFLRCPQVAVAHRRVAPVEGGEAEVARARYHLLVVEHRHRPYPVGVEEVKGFVQVGQLGGAEAAKAQAPVPVHELVEGDEEPDDPPQMMPLDEDEVRRDGGTDGGPS